MIERFDVVKLIHLRRTLVNRRVIQQAIGNK